MMNKNNLTGHVYVLLFPNGKRYVGQTIQTIEKRMILHVYDLKRGSMLPIHNAMRKYGKDNVKIEKVFTLKCTQEYLNFIEDRAIMTLNALAPNGYNLRRGGSHGAFSEETKVKMSVAHKGLSTSWTKRKHHSEESKMKMSVAHKGKHLSEEHKAKVSAALTGHFSPMKGKHLSEETKAKISATLKGRPISTEHKAKLSAIKTGTHLSQETIAKRTATRKKRRQERNSKQ